MQIAVTVQDANNIVCEVTPPQPEIIVIDRGVEGNGIVSIVPVTISTFQYLRITYTNGTVQDVGPLTSTAYTATAPITIVGNTISLATVPIASGGTDATTAAGAIQNLLPSYTGNGNKRLGLNSGATALEWVLDGGGTVTSVAASGGTTGLSFTGSPITTSGTLTLGGTLETTNGGTGLTSFTANGVVYASSTSALTTGSALTFDGTRLTSTTGKFGGGGAVNSASLMVNNATNTATGIQLFQDGIESWIMGMPANSGALTWSASGSEQMRLTNLGLLGIGTSSPTEALTITNDATYKLSLKRAADGSYAAFGATGNSLLIYNNGATRATIDSSGNLGLGLAPSAWLSTYKAIQNGRSSFVNDDNGRLQILSNAFVDSGGAYRYIASTFASLDWYVNGERRWYTAPSGTAGNAISFTQAMTLNSNGPTVLNLKGSTSNNGGSAFYITQATSSGTLCAFGDASAIIGGTPDNSTALWSVAGVPIIFYIGTERARIDPSGNFLLGTTTSSGYNMTISGASDTVIGTKIINTSGSSSNLCMFATSSTYSGSFGVASNSGWLAVEGDNNLTVGPTGAGNITFVNNATERARIDSSGNLLVGTTSAGSGSLLTVAGGIQSNDYRQTGTGYITWNTSAGSNSLIFRDSANERARIDSSGNFGINITSPSTFGSLAVAAQSTPAIAQISALASSGYNSPYTASIYLGDARTDNIDNGVVCGYRIKSYGANASTGAVLTFETANRATGSSSPPDTFTERMRLNSSGNFGIGTSSPVTKLHVYSATGNSPFGDNVGMTQIESGGGNNASLLAKNYYGYSQFMQWENYGVRIGVRGIANGGQGNLVFTSGNDSEAARIDSSGNLLVGTTTATFGQSGRGLIELNGTSQALIALKAAGAAKSYWHFNGTDVDFLANNGCALNFYSNGAFAGKFDTSGNFLVGTTSTFASSKATIKGAGNTLTVWEQNGSSAAALICRLDNTSGRLTTYNYAGTDVGTVTTNGSSTAYNTSSDYRLKNITGPITNSGAYIDSLNPVEGTWKADGSTFVGLIAHEVQQASRTNVATGVKDGEEMQAMDYSSAEIIANLIAEIQSLRKRLADAGI